jgi:hypothetical protein
LFRFTGSHGGKFQHLLTILSNAAKRGIVLGEDGVAPA